MTGIPAFAGNAMIDATKEASNAFLAAKRNVYSSSCPLSSQMPDRKLCGECQVFSDHDIEAITDEFRA